MENNLKLLFNYPINKIKEFFVGEEAEAEAKSESEAEATTQKADSAAES